MVELSLRICQGYREQPSQTRRHGKLVILELNVVRIGTYVPQLSHKSHVSSIRSRSGPVHREYGVSELDHSGDCSAGRSECQRTSATPLFQCSCPLPIKLYLLHHPESFNLFLPYQIAGLMHPPQVGGSCHTTAAANCHHIGEYQITKDRARWI